MSSEKVKGEGKAAQKTFEELGISEQLAETCRELGWKAPSEIQQESIPWGLQGRDVIALAKTGSGKTGAFALPILQALLQEPRELFALVLSPTRELAIQIAEQFEALGAGIGLRAAVLVGGIDMVGQAIALARLSLKEAATRTSASRSPASLCALSVA